MDLLEFGMQRSEDPADRVVRGHGTSFRSVSASMTGAFSAAAASLAPAERLQHTRLENLDRQSPQIRGREPNVDQLAGAIGRPSSSPHAEIRVGHPTLEVETGELRRQYASFA
jgi:hypothetical protein